jgi:hypothetical protein
MAAAMSGQFAMGTCDAVTVTNDTHRPTSFDRRTSRFTVREKEL